MIVQVRGQVRAARGAHTDRSICTRERPRRSVYATRPRLSPSLPATAARRVSVPDAFPFPWVRIHYVRSARRQSRLQQLQQHDVQPTGDLCHVAVAEAQGTLVHGRLRHRYRHRRQHRNHHGDYRRRRHRRPSRVREHRRLLRRRVRKRKNLLPDEEVPAARDATDDTGADFVVVSTYWCTLYCRREREFFAFR